MQEKIQRECKNTKQEFGQYILYLKHTKNKNFRVELVAECSFESTFSLLPSTLIV